jgi:hypothetical protein
VQQAILLDADDPDITRLASDREGLKNELITILLGGLLAQEIPNMRILLAALVIVGSVVLINVSRRIKVKVRWP